VWAVCGLCVDCVGCVLAVWAVCWLCWCRLCWCRLSLCESELALSESKVNELNRAVTLMKEAEQELVKLHKAEMTRAHEVVTGFISSLALRCVKGF